jgi:hypothetical protein
LTSPVHEQLAKCMGMFTLNLNDALALAATLAPKKKAVAESQAKRWVQQQFYCVGSETGRLYTSASGLKKQFRRSLLCNGEPVCEIDVSCCQPVLLGNLMAGHVSAAELEQYNVLTQSGQLYEVIASDIAQIRDMVKAAIVKWLCGSWFHSQSPLKPGSKLDANEKALRIVVGLVHDWFMHKFPGVCAYLKAEKTNESYRAQFQTKARGRKGQSTQPSAIISHRLQRLESQIVIDSCCQSLLDQDPAFPILTIHDGLVVPESRGQTALAELKKCFLAHGMSPKIEIKC